MSWSLIVHAHTRHSYDALTAPSALVDRAVALGAHALAITDHDTWRGSIEASDDVAHIPISTHSLNAAMAATIGLYELAHRIRP